MPVEKSKNAVGIDVANVHPSQDVMLCFAGSDVRRGYRVPAVSRWSEGMGGDLDAERILVEAIGEPGERRFRLLAIVNGQTYSVWMEKQQVQALGLALEQMLERLPDAGAVLPESPGLAEFDRETRKQFRVGRMELGYDDDEDRIVVVAHDLNGQEEADASFACRMTRGQARDLSAEAAAVVAAGRAHCTMCGEPMGSEPHVCPQQNGHFRHDLEAVDDIEDV